MAYPDPTIMGNMPALGEDIPGYGMINPSDPYIQLMLKRQMMARQLRGDQPPQNMTHWTQPLAHMVKSGLGAWQDRMLEDRMLDYSRKQSEAADAEFARVWAQHNRQQPAPQVSSGGAAPSAPTRLPVNLTPEVDAAVSSSAGKYGVPLPLARALVMQESGGRPDAPNGGLGQVLDSTARDPGYGMQGVDPATLKQPAPNADFSMNYLASKAKARGLDINDQAQWPDVLRLYNGGGDPNYVANVSRYLPEAVQTPNAPAPATQPAMPQAPTGYGGMTRQQLRDMQVAILMNPRIAADPRYSRMAHAYGVAADAIREPKMQTVAPGSTLFDVTSGRAIYQAPEAPDRTLERVRMADGSERLVPRGQAGGMTSAPPVSPLPPLLNEDLMRQQERLNQARADRQTFNAGENKMHVMAVEGFRDAQKAASDAAGRAVLYNRLDRAISQFPPGRDFNIRIWSQQVGAALGMKPENIKEGEIGNMIASRLAIQAAPKGQGQVSNYERSLFATALPQMTTTPEGTREAIQLMRDLDAMDIEAAKIYRDNARKNNGIPDPVSVSEELANMYQRLSGPIREKMLGYGGTQEAGALSQFNKSDLEAEARRRGLIP